VNDTRHLTHVELLHRPGERELAARFFALLGCEPVDRGGHWLSSLVDPDGERNFSDNVMYVSEVGEAQWALDQTLERDPAVIEHRAAVRRQPQMSGHFGFRVATDEALAAIVDRVRTAGADDPQLAGRVDVSGVYRPGEDGAIAPNMVQAFIWTDIVAVGLLALGQHIEVQWHLPA
jgi:hypothetical protein